MAILATAQNTYPKAVEVPGDMKAGTYEVTFSGSTDYVTGGVSPIAAIKQASGFGTSLTSIWLALDPRLRLASLQPHGMRPTRR
jgi:hypothetical protein